MGEKLESLINPRNINKPAERDINIGDVVKVLSGPFKGETATVKAVNKEKEELTVMFLESAVPINVNIKISDVSTIKRVKLIVFKR